MIFILVKNGIHVIKKKPALPGATVVTMVGAELSLLTFTLAITFQIDPNHYDTRKRMILEEVSNIRTTYLQTELFQEPIQSDMKKLLTEYVDLSIELQKDQSKLDYTISRSQQILDRLWEQTKAIPETDRNTVGYGL